jgi:hypothetical protein
MTDSDLTIDVQAEGGARPAHGTIARGEFVKLNVPPDQIASISYRGAGMNCRLRHDDIWSSIFGSAQMGSVIDLQGCQGPK